MLNFFAKKIFGSQNDRLLKKIYPIVENVNKLEKKYEKLNDEDLIKKTEEFRKLLKME